MYHLPAQKSGKDGLIPLAFEWKLNVFRTQTLTNIAHSDPYLAGQLASVTISGMQENVIACTKHFIVNEQETNRNPSYNFVAYGVGAGTYNESVSSNLDDKTMHELYLWPFQDAVRAGAGSIMCSYNRINNSYGCANSYTMNNLLKTELGFQGMVVSDWFAQVNTYSEKP